MVLRIVRGAQAVGHADSSKSCDQQANLSAEPADHPNCIPDTPTNPVELNPSPPTPRTPVLPLTRTSEFNKSALTHQSELFLDGEPHRIFTWVPAQDAVAGVGQIDLEDQHIVQNHGVPLPILVKCIKHEIRNEKAFLNLPWALLLCATFIMQFIGHENVDKQRGLEEAIGVDLYENAAFGFPTPINANNDGTGNDGLDDVHKTEDVFSWLRLGLVPLLFKTGKEWSELQMEEDPHYPDVPLTGAQINSYLQYNRLIGGVRLSQTQAVSTDCNNPDLAGAYDMHCSSSALASATSDSVEFNVQPEYLDITSLRSEEEFDPGLTRWFLTYQGREDVELRLKQMEVANWISNRTQHVTVHFLSYNAHFDFLTYNGVHFFFARTGRLWKKIIHSSISLDHYINGHWVYVADGIFVLLILRLLILEIMEIHQAFRKRHKYQTVAGWLKDYCNLWNLVDWISIAICCTMVGMSLRNQSNVKILEQELLNVSKSEIMLGKQTGATFVDRFENDVENLIIHCNDVYNYRENLRAVACVIPIFLMLRLFKAFSAQPRLALVTQTLSRALVDVSHFMVVFTAIFITFVVMAVGLFGREMPQFSTFGRAFNTCFAMLMGEFEYQELFSKARTWGAIWFWLFHVLLGLLMLNMLLAIVMECHSDVTSKSSNAATIVSQLSVIVQRAKGRRAGTWQPLTMIDNKLAEAFGVIRKEKLDKLSITTEWSKNDIISLQGFADAIDGMEMEQAMRLMKLAVHHWRLENSSPVNLTEAMIVISSCHEHLEKQQETFAHLNLESVTTNKNMQSGAQSEMSDAKFAAMAAALEHVTQRVEALSVMQTQILHEMREMKHSKDVKA